MPQMKRSLYIIGAGIVVVGVLLLLTSLAASNYLVDIWWFHSLNYEFYYWQRLLYRYAIFIGVTLIFFLIFWLNFRIASSHLGESPPPTVPGMKPMSIQSYKHLVKLFRTGSMWVYTPLSLILAIPIALPLFRQWQAFLLYIFGQGTGVADPVYGKDIAYYLFSFPIYMLIQRRLLIAFVLLFVALLILYLLENRLLSRQERELPRGAKWHLNILLILIFLVEFWHYILERYELLYIDHHEPLFYGPGFAEMNVVLPLIWITLAFLICTAFALMYFLYRQDKKSLAVLGIFVACCALAMGARYSNFLPNLVQKYIVKPNAISKERPYIEHSISAALSAYDLNNVEVRDFAPERVPADIAAPKIQNILRNIPVWDGEVLTSVYEQLQELRTYYNFSNVDVSHYIVNDLNQQVFLAARELNPAQLPQGARNWVNEHLTYTHGYGAVMTPAAQGGDEPMTWFIRGIPLESDFGFKVAQPGIYYGHLPHYDYVIAPNDAGELDYPRGASNVISNYQGRGGVPISSLYRKLLFAYYFKDKNIFFTTKTNSESRILFRRSIQERIKTLTPFFILDKDPYLVVTKDHLYWIQDAYTSSKWYPNAQTYTIGDKTINYIRNSVKIVVDAYDGSVNYYIFNPKDPIIEAYSRIYPGVFKSKEDMPADIMPLVRYPQDYFNIQMEIYATYHQIDPEVFYQQEDAWEFTSSVKGPVEVASAKSYYLTLDLIDPGRFDFLLLSPMSPKGKSNLRALALVGAQPSCYGKIVIYNFPKGELVYGPSQVYALINQDTKVSEQFTLWDQVGSQVERGKMIILPIGKVIVYIQPVYLKSSTQLKIPELKRLIMTQGQVVVMEPSLEEAYGNLEKRIKAEIGRVDKRFAPSAPQTSPPPGSPAPPRPGAALPTPSAASTSAASTPSQPNDSQKPQAPAETPGPASESITPASATSIPGVQESPKNTPAQPTPEKKADPNQPLESTRSTDSILNEPPLGEPEPRPQPAKVQPAATSSIPPQGASEPQNEAQPQAGPQ